MSEPGVLFVGGSGVVGRHAIDWFRQGHADMPILVGGRHAATAEAVAGATANAEAVVLDPDRPRLGLDTEMAAVTMLAPDNALYGLSFAHQLGVPYLNISSGMTESGAEMAHFIHRPSASPVVLASHWAAGAPTLLALHAAGRLDRVHAIRIGVVLDDEEPVGPAALADMTRLQAEAPVTLAFESGQRVRLSGDATRHPIETLDGRVLTGQAFDPFDIVSLHAATGAPNIRFDLTSEVSSSRRRGDGMATEIIVDIEGMRGDAHRHLRATLEFGPGQASLTGLCTALLLSALLGQDGSPPARPGFYFPERLLEVDRTLKVLSRAGAMIQVAPR
ncbi:hypothetical protein C7446_0702 [Kushneria sinocarnis]|uniref:Saccharopine dehydrogenase-like NADP-dependent oxidoreductase n=1 Tax=Kushneria sinocarnis TaxID=595502 RepID=A0A420WZQ0_9GAMM|nr:hypothetical protein [Kushneria sinocarnis]RKR06709.1 hypothetical protein C7446_0702 [Kushneria sinocarnis]